MEKNQIKILFYKFGFVKNGIMFYQFEAGMTTIRKFCEIRKISPESGWCYRLLVIAYYS